METDHIYIYFICFAVFLFFTHESLFRLFVLVSKSFIEKVTYVAYD